MNALSKLAFRAFAFLIILPHPLFSLDKASMLFDPQGSVALSNSFVKVVLASDGKFSIGTTGGDPDRSSDDNKPLLYGFPAPGTSETMVKIDGTEYAFGSSGTQVTAPSRANDALVCAWRIGNVVVTQSLSIVTNDKTGNSDTVQVKYTFRNTDTAAHTAALRVQLDTLLGDNDGAPFRVFGYGSVTRDKEWDSLAATASIPDIPPFCHVFDRLINPRVFSIITVDNAASLPPDRFVLGYWPDAVGKWDYTVVPTRSFIDNDGDGTVSGSSPDSDSSAITWWGYSSPIALASGSSADCILLYGLSGMDSFECPPFAVGIPSFGQFPVTAQAGTSPFGTLSITVYVENASSAAVNNASLELNLPPEFSLAAGEQSRKYIEEVAGSRTIGARKQSQLVWRIDTFGRYTGKRAVTLTLTTPAGSRTMVKNVTVPGVANAVYGQVTTPAGSPVSGAVVEVLRGSSVVATLTTTANGAFLFNNLPYGDYDVRTTVAGATPSLMRATVSAAGAGTCPVMAPAPPEDRFEGFAYPNPVRESTIRFRCFSGQAKDITIKIFDGIGGLVKTLSLAAAGNSWSETVWDVSDVANGVYFFKFEGSGISKVGKIVVLKRKR